uniref:Acetoacetyl-CoA synthetase n=1 Tax=Ursus americanus TaxID=9643 RepID=A0A452QI16_URSAM
MSKQLRASREEILECQVMWEPDSKKNTQMDRFRAAVGAACGLVLENYDDLYHWSVESYPDFWAEFWKFSGIVFSRMYDEVVDTSKGIADVPAWFKGSRLNYAENLLRHKENDRVALYAAREGKEEIVKVTFEELRQQVALFAAAMRKMGVKQGDRVVGYLPNGVHAVEAMLAAASIGAIWSSTSPDFGVNGVLDRFSQIQPKLIFSVEAVVYNGKEYSHMDKLQRVVKGLPDLKKVVLIPYIASKEKIDISKIPNSVFLDEFLATRKGEQAPQLEFEQLPFSHPLFVMFSSGTTGAPKCMVHSAGGTLIQHLKEHVLHGNMGSGDIMLYYTTVGWMMWNWMVSALATGAAVVLYDGSPLVPTPNVLWDLVDRIGFTLNTCEPGSRWGRVCVCVCVRTCACVCMCAQVCRVCMCMWGQEYVCLHVWTSVCARVSEYMKVCEYVRVRGSACMVVRAHECVCMHMVSACMCVNECACARAHGECLYVCE